MKRGTILLVSVFLVSTAVSDVYLEACKADFVGDPYGGKCGCGSWCRIVGDGKRYSDVPIRWNAFPGASGVYDVYVDAALDKEGQTPFRITINGQDVCPANAKYYATEERGKPPAEVLCNEAIQISQGDEVVFYGSSVYSGSKGSYSRLKGLIFKGGNDATRVSIAPEQTIKGHSGTAHVFSITGKRIGSKNAKAWSAHGDAISAGVYLTTSDRMNRPKLVPVRH